MHVTFRNVNDAFRDMVDTFNGRTSLNLRRSTSRNGDVLYIQEPVIITYTHPQERVLFNQARDCNPFFHLYEALWMLAGRNDVAPLAYYNSNIANYSDDGQTFNGAYGYRWRKAQVPDDETWVAQGSEFKTIDQLKLIIDHLKAVPDSRRVVLTMWNVEDDLLKIGTPIDTTTEANKEFRTHKPNPNYSKDVCCNTHVYFSLRETQCPPNDHSCQACGGRFLDMTVCNRSNDLIWGLLGANAVHFSFLQEYMAACIGVEVGVYNQITNNCHVYLNDKWQPEKWLNDDYLNPYLCNPWRAQDQPFPLFPLVKDPATFDKELVSFVGNNRQQFVDGDVPPELVSEPFLRDAAQPMFNAFHAHKRRDYTRALEWIDKVQADDWRIAGRNWLLKRKAGYEARTK